MITNLGIFNYSHHFNRLLKTKSNYQNQTMEKEKVGGIIVAFIMTTGLLGMMMFFSFYDYSSV